jgi:hypothetical protein
MKLNGYICIYLYALYTNTISSSLSTGKLGASAEDYCENGEDEMRSVLQKKVKIDKKNLNGSFELKNLKC